MFSICRLRLHIHFPLILLVSNFFLVYSYQEKNFFHKYVNFVYESTHKLLTDHYGSLYKYKYDKLLMQEPSVASIKSPSILTYQESNNAQEGTFYGLLYLIFLSFYFICLPLFF